MADDNTPNNSNNDLPPSHAMPNNNPSLDSPFDPSNLISQTRIASPRQAIIVPRGAGFAQGVKSAQLATAQLEQMMLNSDRIAAELKAKADAGKPAGVGDREEHEDEDSGSEDETTVSLQSDDNATVVPDDIGDEEQKDQEDVEGSMISSHEPASKTNGKNEEMHKGTANLDGVADQLARTALSSGVPPSWAGRQTPFIFRNGLNRLEYQYDRYYDTDRTILNWLRYRPVVPRSHVPSWTSIYDPPGAEEGVYRRPARRQELLDELAGDEDGDEVVTVVEAGGEFGAKVKPEPEVPAIPGSEHDDPGTPSVPAPEPEAPEIPARTAAAQLALPATPTEGVVLTGFEPSTTVRFRPGLEDLCVVSGGVKLTAEEAKNDTTGLVNEIEEAGDDASAPWT